MKKNIFLEAMNGTGNIQYFLIDNLSETTSNATSKKYKNDKNTNRVQKLRKGTKDRTERFFLLFLKDKRQKKYLRKNVYRRS